MGEILIGIETAFRVGKGAKGRVRKSLPVVRALVQRGAEAERVEASLDVAVVFIDRADHLEGAAVGKGRGEANSEDLAWAVGLNRDRLGIGGEGLFFARNRSPSRALSDEAVVINGARLQPFKRDPGPFHGSIGYFRGEH